MEKKLIINDKELLKLQKRFRSGEIKEEDLSSREIQQLKELYKKQIDFIKESIENDKKEIIKLKRKIGK